MLKAISDDFNLATYGSSYRYYGFLLIGLGAVKAVYFPTIQSATSKQEMRDVFRNHRILVLSVSSAIIIVNILSGRIIPLVDGGKYPQAIETFRVLSISVIVSFAFSPYTTIIMKFEKFTFMLSMIVVNAVLNIVLNFILIPILGAVGAASTTLLSFGIFNCSAFLYSKKLMKHFS
jgi:O-antigen/teichoic acid export membrane protein